MIRSDAPGMLQKMDCYNLIAEGTTLYVRVFMAVDPAVSLHGHKFIRSPFVRPPTISSRDELLYL